jgi:hypothetical protein
MSCCNSFGQTCGMWSVRFADDRACLLVVRAYGPSEMCSGETQKIMKPSLCFRGASGG